MNELFHLFETIPASRKLDVQLSLRPPRFQSVWRFQQMDIAKNLYTIFRGILLAAIYVARRCVSILNRHLCTIFVFPSFQQHAAENRLNNNRSWSMEKLFVADEMLKLFAKWKCDITQ